MVARMESNFTTVASVLQWITTPFHVTKVKTLDKILA
jgi:hypothetical protein